MNDTFREPTSRGADRGAAGTAEGNPSTDQALLRAARSLFAQKGYDGASIRAITRQAGANLGAVTYHFGSKRALYESVLETVLEPLRRRIAEASRGERLPLDRMEAVIRSFFRHLEENPDMPQLMLQELAAGKTPPPVIVRTLQQIAGTLAMIVGEGQSDLSIRPGDPLLMALSVIYQPVHFTLIRELAREIMGLDQADPETRGRIVDHAVEFARRGLAGNPEAFQ